MIACRWVVAVLCLSFLCCSNLRSEEGWKFSNLNPFKGSEEPTPKPKKKARSKVSDVSGSSWKFWESKSPKANPRSTQPSAWDRMSSGTKNFVSKTKATLTPWKTEEPTTRRPPTGTNRGLAKKPEKKTGLFASWQKDADAELRKEKQTETVLDFLDRPRPE